MSGIVDSSDTILIGPIIAVIILLAMCLAILLIPSIADCQTITTIQCKENNCTITQQPEINCTWQSPYEFIKKRYSEKQEEKDAA